jgi:2,4-dienoyl-CoA reductase-like NADH-dependent reductase (Old Yellow Enzyme family)
MTHIDIEEFVSAFVSSARRAIQAGFRVIEIHAAHGYLLHEFMSPLSNHRMDEYGGSLDNRIRLTVELAREVRREIGDDIPLFVRVSATDWLDGGWTVADTVHLGIRLREAGVDLVDCSSGAIVDNVDIDVYEGYQVPLAREVRKGAGIATAAVGLITRAAHADEVIRSQGADAVFLGRALLRNPHWPLLAAEELGVQAPWPIQYLPASRRRRP